MYVITHLATARVYVGSTTNMSKRWSRHRLALRRGTHPNRHLQAAWNAYGEHAFAWRVLAWVEPSERIAVEQAAIDHYQATGPARGFNKAPTAGVSPGMTGRTMPAEQRAKIAASNRATKAHLKHQAGARCPKGHVKDGSYVKVRPNGSVKIRCQVCERTTARERARARRADRARG